MRMKTKYLKKETLGLILLLALSPLWAQQSDTLTVDSNNGELGVLNDLLSGDTTETGERAHAVYKLKRGQTYVLSGAIENRGYHLNMVAESGTGARPILKPGVISGGSSSRPITARGDLTLKGIFLTGKDQAGGLNPNQRIIRVQSTGVRIILDDCVMDQDGQAAFRTDNGGLTIKVTNTRISNIGQPQNTFNGRVIDDRGSNLDTVIFENCTFYNISNNIMNDRGGWIKYAKMNNNTIVNVGSRVYDFGETFTAIYTNNIAINVGYLGRIEDPEVPVDWGSVLFRYDTISETAQANFPDLQQTLTFQNNNFYTDEAIINAWPTAENVSDFDFTDNPVVAVPIALPNSAWELFAGETQMNSNISESIEFSNGPSIEDLALIIDQFYKDPNHPDNKTSVKSWDISNEPFNFRYDGLKASATASTTGGQLGDLNWELILTGKAGLSQAMDVARDLLDNAVVGGNIGNTTQEAVDLLTEALADAQIVFDNLNASSEEVDAAIASLNGAIEAFQGFLITGLESNSLTSEVMFYPNPVKDYIIFANEDIVAYEILDHSGRLISRSKVIPNAKLSVSGLDNGIYFMRLHMSNNESKSFKLIKK